MLSNDPAGHLGPVQFGNLDMGKVPAHIRDAPLPNLPPPTVFPVSGFREDKKGEDPQEHGFTSSPAGNPRFQDIASRVDIPSPTCNRSKQQAQAQGQPQQQIGSDSYELKMSSKANFKELVQGSTGQMKASIVQKVPLSAAYDQCKGKSAGIGVESNLNVTVNGGLRGNSTECSSYKQQEPAVPSAMRALAPVSSQVREHCQEGHAALEIGHGADAATIEGGSSASCHSCSSSGAKPIPPPYSTVEECLVSTPSSSQLLEEQNSPYSGQAARWGPESGDVPSSAAAQPALGQLHACAPSSPQSSQASTGNMNPASTTGEQALEPTSSTCGPKVVVAIPSTLNAGASGKKMTWASIVSKPPKRVPYTTQAAGTIAPVTCCAESIVGSHLLAGKASPSIPGTRQQQPESPGTCERNLTSHLMTGRGGMRTSRESDLYSEAGSYKNGGVDKNSSGSRQDLDWSQTHVHSMPSGQAECGSGVSGPPASSAPKSDFNYRNSRQDFHSRDEHSHSRPSVTAGSRCSVPYGHCNASIPSRGGLHAKRVPCTLSQKGSPITENKSWGAQPARRSSTDSDRLKCFSTVRGLSSDGSPVTNVEVIPGAIDNQHIQCFPGDDLLGNALSAPSAGYICDRQQQGNMGVPLQATPKDVASTSTCLRSHEQCKTSFSSELHQEGQQSVFNSPVTSDRMADVLNTLCGTEPMEARRFYEQGIMNLGNTCFLGSAMQLLLGSELFCGLLHQLEAVRGQLHRGRLPTLCALGDLASKLSKRHEVNQPDGKSVSNSFSLCYPSQASRFMPVLNLDDKFPPHNAVLSDVVFLHLQAKHTCFSYFCSLWILVTDVLMPSQLMCVCITSVNWTACWGCVCTDE